jgi:hypothetical protein
MNNLLYNARMALRDIMEVNIFTKGTDRVYLSVSADLAGASAGQVDTKNVILTVVDRLADMDMVLARGQDAIGALMAAEPVEILRKAA